MVDSTRIKSVSPIELETLSSSYNIHKNNSQIEINNYYVNYIDDPSIPLEINTDNTSISIIEDSECRLEVSQLPEEIFIDENIRCEFECIFHEFDPEIIISYSKIFQRVYLTFSDRILASQVRKIMNGKPFHHKNLLLKNSSSIEYLKPPKHDRIYMQSPPTTPPIGWVTKREELPEINFDLFLALSKLQPHQPLEILPKQNHHPAIIIHPCSDTSDDEEENHQDEFRYKKYTTIEDKRRAQILHDAILVPGEQQITQITGDGDKII